MRAAPVPSRPPAACVARSRLEVPERTSEPLLFLKSTISNARFVRQSRFCAAPLGMHMSCPSWTQFRKLHASSVDEILCTRDGHGDTGTPSSGLGSVCVFSNDRGPSTSRENSGGGEAGGSATYLTAFSCSLKVENAVAMSVKCSTFLLAYGCGAHPPTLFLTK